MILLGTRTQRHTYTHTRRRHGYDTNKTPHQPGSLSKGTSAQVASNFECWPCYAVVTVATHTSTDCVWYQTTAGERDPEPAGLRLLQTTAMTYLPARMPKVTTQ